MADGGGIIAAATLLEATDVVASYGGAPALRGVSIAVRAGETLALCGPNGAGKSTLLSVLAGELAPDRGAVRLMGRDVFAAPPSELALERAVLEQSTSVTAPFTVRALAALGAEVAPLDQGYDAEAVAERSVTEAGVRALADRRVDRLSGGEAQRAHFARVLAQLHAGRCAGMGRALLLDEPTASLDLNRQVEILRAARAQADAGATVVAVLHDLNLAAAFADRVALMKDGAIAAVGAPPETFTAETLSAVYEIDIHVDHTPEGRPRVFPDYAGVRQ